MIHRKLMVRARASGSSIAVLFATVCGAQAQESVRVVTLEEAMALAQKADPALIAATGAEGAARAAVRQANAAWLPSLSMNSSYANSSNQRFDQASGRLVSESYAAQMAVSYPLFTGGRRLLQRASAGAERRAAAALSAAQRFETDLATQRAFYEAAAAVELLEAAGQRLARARQQLDFAETRLEVGTATRSDLLRAELEMGNAELGVVDAETALRAARLALGRRLGLSGEAEPAPDVLPTEAPPLPTPEALARQAERSSPDAVAAQATLSARRAETRASYASYLPTITASGGYDWFSFEFPPTDRSWSFRVFASIPIFNGLQRETTVARARVAERTSEARARDILIAVRNESETAAREITAAERRVAIAGRAIRLAEEDLRVQEERYQLGNATIVDLQTSQVALAVAEVEFVRSRQRLATAVGELEAVLGMSVDEVSGVSSAGAGNR